MKQVILIRQDLKMDKGKLAVQTSHASVEAVLASDPKKIKFWKETGAKKVVVKVKDLEELLNLKKKAEGLGLVTALIKDAGKTFFKKPTITALAIGPDEEEKIDKVTGHLKIL